MGHAVFRPAFVPRRAHELCPKEVCSPAPALATTTYSWKASSALQPEFMYTHRFKTMTAARTVFECIEVFQAAHVAARYLEHQHGRARRTRLHAVGCHCGPAGTYRAQASFQKHSRGHHEARVNWRAGIPIHDDITISGTSQRKPDDLVPRTITQSPEGLSQNEAGRRRSHEGGPDGLTCNVQHAAPGLFLGEPFGPQLLGKVFVGRAIEGLGSPI